MATPSYPLPASVDPFDAQLISDCEILAPNPTPDEAGQLSGAPTVVATVKARLSQGRGRVKERKSEKKVGIAYHTIFMRPYAGLTIKHDLRLGGTRYDIIHIDNPGGMGHHFECTVEEIDD